MSAQKLITEALKPFSRGDQRLMKLLEMSVGRVLNRMADEDFDWQHFYKDDQLEYIADWLANDLKNDATWIKNVDALGRPKKLLKFSNVEGIVREAEKLMMIERQKAGDRSFASSEEELFDQLPDGCYFVKLKTPAAINREIVQLQLDADSYDHQLDELEVNPHRAMLSLRNSVGKSLALIEIDGRKVDSIAGKRGALPEEDHFRAIIDYFTVTKNDVFNVNLALLKHGLAMSAKNEVTRLNSLPVNFESKGTLNFRRQRLALLPKGLIVNGHLVYANPQVTKVSNLEVRGSAVFEHMTNLRTLKFGKHEHHISGDLTISHCHDLRNLPKNLEVGGTLTIIDCRKLKKLPDGLKVGSLNISGTLIDIDSLPASLHDDVMVTFDENEKPRPLGVLREINKHKKAHADDEQSSTLKM